MLFCKKIITSAITAFLFLISPQLSSQQKLKTSFQNERCGTMFWLENMFKDVPGFQTRYDENEKKLGLEINQIIQEKNINQRSNRTISISTIPVVFHVILSNQSQVPDAMILAQLNRLNQDYSGLNADSANGLPFFSVRGHSKIQFCLAQRTPFNSSTTGIDRITSGTLSNAGSIDPVKSTANGGADAWDPDKYINIWIANFSQPDFLGYSTFPIGTPENPNGLQSQQGVVIHPGTLPGGSNTPFNLGRTLTHESGHYLNLLHNWGDDTQGDVFRCPTSGGCSGSDFPGNASIDDTPNQCAATDGCFSGLHTDICSPASPGFMYQNFMDYTYDPCMTMFSKGQIIRAETALSIFRPGLLTSTGCLPPVLVPNNASIFSIVSPVNNFRTCDLSVPLSITLRNAGSNLLSSVIITVKRNGTIIQTLNLTSLNMQSGTMQNINLNAVSLETGTNFIEVCTSLPNGQVDGDLSDDCKTVSGIRSATDTPLPLSEGFESTNFPPTGWLINNPDNYFTWQKNTDGVSHGGFGKAFINNFNYGAPGQTDDLITPPLNVGKVDSMFIDFWGAYRSFPGNPSEILQVAVSTNCGATFTTVYNASNDTSLVAPAGSSSDQSTAYTPSSINHWVKKSVDITSFINAGNIQLRFRSINNDGNNVFLDDINIRTKVLPEKLKKVGYLIIPNPFHTKFNVWFLHQPAALTYINVYNSIGQLIWSKKFNGNADKVTEINLGNKAPGVYSVTLGYKDRKNNQYAQVVKL